MLELGGRGPAGGLQHPVEMGQPQQVARLGPDLARGIGPGAAGHGSSTGVVTAPAPGSVIRWRTTITGR